MLNCITIDPGSALGLEDAATDACHDRWKGMWMWISGGGLFRIDDPAGEGEMTQCASLCVYVSLTFGIWSRQSKPFRTIYYKSIKMRFQAHRSGFQSIPYSTL